VRGHGPISLAKAEEKCNDPFRSSGIVFQNLYALMKRILILGLLCLLSAARADLTNGLIAYFPFNGNANDATGNGYNGAVNGAVLTSDRFSTPNSAYLFNGASSYIQLSKNLPDTTNFTISAWVQYTSGTYSLPQYYGRGDIFTDSNLAPGQDFQLGVTATNVITVATKGGYNYYREIALGSSISNVWTHVVWVLATNRSTVYINGTSVSTSTNGSANIGLHAPPLIGANSSESPWVAFFGGKIDDLRIYNRSLSAQEVCELYSTETPYGPCLSIFTAIELEFLSRTGKTYYVQASTNFQNWTNFDGPISGDGNIWQKTYSIRGNPQRFYRVELVP
jgi:hypothetical protein